MVVDNLPLVQTPPRKNRAPVRPYAVSTLASALAIVANPALAQDVEPTGDDPSELHVPVPPADADLPELDPRGLADYSSVDRGEEDSDRLA